MLDKGSKNKKAGKQGISKTREVDHTSRYASGH